MGDIRKKTGTWGGRKERRMNITCGNKGRSLFTLGKNFTYLSSGSFRSWFGLWSSMIMISSSSESGV